MSMYLQKVFRHYKDKNPTRYRQKYKIDYFLAHIGLFSSL